MRIEKRKKSPTSAPAANAARTPVASATPAPAANEITNNVTPTLLNRI